MSRLYRTSRLARDVIGAVGVTPTFFLDADSIAGADGATITSVSDAAGGLLTLSQSTGAKKPILRIKDGRKRLVFVQANATELASASGGITGNAAHSMFCVVRQTAGVSANAPITSFGPSGGFTSALGLGFATATNVWAGATGKASPTFAGSNVGGNLVLGKVFNGTNVRAFVNGAQVADLFADTYTVTSAAFGLGTPWTPGALCPNVELLAALWYNVALTAAQTRAVHRFLARRYGGCIQGKVIVEGDSISNGQFFVSDPSKIWPVLVSLPSHMPRPMTMVNTSAVSRRLSQIDTSILGDVYQRLTLSAGDVVCVFAGTNDFFLDGTSVADLQTLLQSYCAKVRAAGAKVLLFSMLPRGTDPTFATKRGQWNPWLATNWPNFGDGFVDFRPSTGLENVNSALYSGDQTHPGDAGHVEMESYVRPELLKLAA